MLRNSRISNNVHVMEYSCKKLDWKYEEKNDKYGYYKKRWEADWS